MALAHEIAVDKDFTLQKIQPANAVEKQATHWLYILIVHIFFHYFHVNCFLAGERDYAEGFLGPA